MNFISSKLLPLTAALVSAASGISSAQELKVGVVDYGRIQRHYYRTEVERKALELRREEEEKKLEGEVTQARKLLEEQQAAQKTLQDPTLSEDKKKVILQEAEGRAQQINDLQRKVLDLQNSANSELSQEANRAQLALHQEIYEAINKIAEAKGIDLVHNRTFGVNGVPSVAYANTKKMVDLTDDVVGELNKNAPADATAPSSGAKKEAPAKKP
ncbi:MAG: chaperone for outer membrane protein [Verrucomicrobia bacterium]|jgi:Skp family chaperone for outer membrane proteins|nr:MAG: chaperone for outer membrane protein [Verrucomicrobiota bacterium]